MYILFLSRIDAKIYIHAQDQFLDLSGRMGYEINLGERFQSQVMVQEIIQFEYKNVKNALALTKEDKSCSYHVYDDCMYTKVVDIMRKSTKEQCTVPWVRDNANICYLPTDINTTFWIAWNRITNQKKDCLRPCRATLVSVGAKNYKQLGHQNFSQAYFYFSPSVMKSEEHYEYSFLKFVGQVGGYLGLYRICLWILELCKFNTLRKDTTSKTKDIKETDETSTKDKLISLSVLALETI